MRPVAKLCLIGDGAGHWYCMCGTAIEANAGLESRFIAA